MFYSIHETWTQELSDNWPKILNELNTFLSKNKSDISAKYTNYTNNNGWKTIPLVFFTIRNKVILEEFPKTKEILFSIPNLIGAEFSILAPNTEIEPHTGYSKQVMRTHLGLKTPIGDISFKCGSEERKWQNGKLFSFNDGILHSAWNKTEKERWVLMIDTPIPFSKYSANDISDYKIKNLHDKLLLDIAPKEKWAEWLSKGYSN